LLSWLPYLQQGVRPLFIEPFHPGCYGCLSYQKHPGRLLDRQMAGRLDFQNGCTFIGCVTGSMVGFDTYQDVVC
jgi:hypothetical protein